MKKHTILLGYFDKQLHFVKRLHSEVIEIDVALYDKRYVFAMKTQQLYTAIEDLLKQIAKAFENHLEDLGANYKALLQRLNTDITDIRPAVISNQSFLFLDKLRAFRHFIRHAYDCELDENELADIKLKLANEFSPLISDFNKFRDYVTELSD